MAVSAKWDLRGMRGKERELIEGWGLGRKKNAILDEDEHRRPR